MTLGPKLEFNPSTVYTTPPTVGWVDISAYVDWSIGVDIKTGRADESSQVTPSTLSLTLVNLDGRFTPGNVSSPYYPEISVPLWIRYTSLDAALSITQVEFTGLVDSWTPDLTGPNSDRSTVITASDVLARMAKFRQIHSPLHEEILLDGPIAFYPMDDGAAGATSFADQSGQLQPPLQVLSIGATGTLDPAGTDGPPGTGSKAPNFTPDLTQVQSAFNTNGLGKYLLTNLTNGLTVGNGHAYTIEWWMKINQDGANSTYNGYRYRYPGMMLFESPLSSSGSQYGGYYDTSFGLLPPDPQPAPYYDYGDGAMTLLLGTNAFGGNMPIGYSGALNVGVWYHFACVSDGGTTSSSAKFYMNGHFMGCTGTTGTPLTYDPPPATVRDLTYLVLAGLPLYGGALLDGSVSYAALYETALTQPRLLEHYIAGRNGFYGESIRNRAVRVLKYAGLGDQSASAAMEVTNTPVINQAPATALSLIHDLEVTEQGLFFIDPSGLPTFWNRSHRYTSAVLTLDSTPGSGNIGNGDVQPILDDQRLINDVTTTTGVSTSFRAVDAASVTANGTYQQAITTVGASPTNADETSRWIVSNHSTALVRIPQIKVDILTQSSMRAAVMAAKLWDRIQFTNLPAGYVFGDMVIEGIQRHYGIDSQVITFTVAPNIASVAPYVIGVAGSDEVDTSANRLGF